MTDVQPTGAPRRSLRRNTAIMFAGTATSRVLGYVRTALLVVAIGLNVGGVANAYDAANRIPNVLYSLLTAGVLNAVIVPQIVRAFARTGGKRTVDRIITLGVVGMLAITIALTACAWFLIDLFFATNDPELLSLAIVFSLWCIPQLFFYGMYTMLGEVLNAREQFGPYMWAPVANNIVAIAGLIVFIAVYGPAVVNDEVSTSLALPWDVGKIALLAGVATLGIAIQAFVLIFPLVRGGYRWRWQWSGPKGELDGVKKVASWALAAVLLEQVGIVYAAYVASRAGDIAGNAPDVAANMAYTQAMLLYLLPHSLVTVSIITAIFTGMARLAAAGDMAGLRASLSRGLRLIGVFTVFATAALMVLAPLAVRVVFPLALDDEIRTVSHVLMAFAAGLVPLGAMVLVKRVYFALEDARTIFLIHIPMTMTLVAVVVTAQLWLDVRWWTVAAAGGLAASNVIAVTLRLRGLRPRLNGLDGRRIMRTHMLALVSVLPAGVLGWILVGLTPDLTGLDKWTALGTAATLAAGIGIAMGVVYGLSLWALRVQEAREVLVPIARRFLPRVR